MLINNTTNEANNIEFISYTGKYPCLCMGILTLKIDGKTVKFGNKYTDNTVNYPSFWRSGGGLNKDYIPYSGEWEIDVNELPDKYKKYAIEIDAIFNSNVPYGCCGGCA